VKLSPDQPVTWQWDEAAGKPERSPTIQDRVVMQVCSRCHARRSVTSEKFIPGDDWLETHRPTLLQQPQYHPDGRIREEVYVWGSFRQSKMYHQGVRCVDCHNPHSLELELPKKQMCLKCHSGSKYATPDHHFHKAGERGSSCIDCHMPQETYMVVDDRRDHSFRIPRPDRSVRLGTPNTCNSCHDNKSAQWAAKKYKQWWGAPESEDKPFASALHAGVRSHPAAGSKLNQAARNKANSTIARATALGRLSGSPSQQTLQAIRQLRGSDDTLMRFAAARALSAFEGGQGQRAQRQAQMRWRLGAPLLEDPSRLVRVEAARALAGAPNTLPGPMQSKPFEAAMNELQTAHRRNADRAATLVNRGNLQLSFNISAEAIEAYRTAIELNRFHTSAYINLADIYQRRGNEQKVQQLLKRGLKHRPEAPALHYAMALSKVRQQQHGAAIASLKKARRFGEDNPQYAYMLAIAYNSTAQPGKAMDLLASALKKFPRNAQLLQAKATIGRDNGRWDAALAAARKLVELAPDNRRYRGLLQQIQRRAP